MLKLSQFPAASVQREALILYFLITRIIRHLFPQADKNLQKDKILFQINKLSCTLPRYLDCIKLKLDKECGLETLCIKYKLLFYLSFMNAKAALINELVRHTYVMLRPSPVAGIGVFALRPIQKGCCDMFSKPGAADDWISVSKDEVNELPYHARQLIENYCLFDADKYYVPKRGFKEVDISLFLNHSDTPNIISVDDGDYFEALCDIAEGEELFIDYGTIVEGE